MIPFSGKIASMVIDTPRGEEIWIGHIHWEDGASVGSSEPALLFIRGMSDEKVFGVSPPVMSPGLWFGELSEWADTPYTVRSTMESDVLSCPTFVGMPSVPMPIPVIADIIDGGGYFTMPTLYALSEDDGFVATMLLNSDAGLYVRASNAWHLLTDDDVVDGLNYNEVVGSSLDMFDQFDRAGQLVHVSAMTPVGEEFTPIRPTQVGVTEEEPLVAATIAQARPLTLDVPTLASAEDLPDAIQAAADNPELQWWVERRVKALGIEAELPWHVEL